MLQRESSFEGQTWPGRCSCKAEGQAGRRSWGTGPLSGAVSVSLMKCSLQFSRSVVSNSLQPHGLQHARPPCPSPSPGVHQPMSTKSVMPSSHLILCCSLLLLPPIPPSIRVFSSESVLCVRWPKYWSFSFNISRSNEHPGLVSFRMDWLDLLAVQGTLKSLLQHNSKASILWHSAFFIESFGHISLYAQRRAVPKNVQTTAQLHSSHMLVK